MTLLATQNMIQSNVIAYESLAEYGFCRETISIDNSTPFLALGTVLVNDAEYTGGVAIGGGDKVSIVIGGELGTDQFSETGTDEVLQIINGMCGVRREALTYTGTVDQTNTDIVVAAIEANMVLVKVEDSHVDQSL